MNNNQIFLTLDAGGTNLAFSAMQNFREITQPFSLPTCGDNLDKCLSNIIAGFEQTIKQCPQKPAAISFAFPGPADYVNGIIGDLPNLPAFKGGVALGDYLKDKFGLPVFINNDGDLFAYGESFMGVLPHINETLTQAGAQKKYKNLLGITLGTGTGGGLVHDGKLFIGDNNASLEIWAIRNPKYPNSFIEEGVSIRGVKRSYALLSGDKTDLSPKDIYEIADGKKTGDIGAAQAAFEEMGFLLGDLIANLVAVIDGVVVLGGGMVESHKFYMDALMKELNGKIAQYDNKGFVPRTVLKAYNLLDAVDAKTFYKNDAKKIKVPQSNKEVLYNEEKKIPICITKLGTNKAISIGACAIALASLQS